MDSAVKGRKEVLSQRTLPNAILEGFNSPPPHNFYFWSVCMMRRCEHRTSSRVGYQSGLVFFGHSYHAPVVRRRHSGFF